MKPLFHPRLILVAALLLTTGGSTSAQSNAQPNPSTVLAESLKRLDAALPLAAAEFAAVKPETIVQAAAVVERAAAAVADYDDNDSAREMLQATEQLLSAKEQVDMLLNRTLDKRTGLADLAQDEKGRDTIRHFLRTTAALIDLSGRLRYSLVDALNEVAIEVADKPGQREQLIDLVCRHKSGVGAFVMGVVLNDPPPDAPAGVGPVSMAAKAKLLRLIADTGQTELLGVITRFLRDPQSPPPLVVAAVETIRDLGVPQDPRIGQDPTLPKPITTARELLTILSHVDASQFDDDLTRRRDELVKYLTARAKQGLPDDTYRLGSFDVHPGDWLLMRNPSPYNLFTDLSPGLFTHVGVITIETGGDGTRRMVVVDLPETGNRMPATNVDIFVQRTRHFAVLRHPDPAVAQKMGQVAATVIGNETLFDLNFRADRVTELKGQPLAGKKIHTYCAGLLQLCAQETTAPTSDFFPLAEFPGPGKTRDNCARFGIQFGEQVVSPTGALFSPKLQLVGRSEPMYDPRREIEEAIYDHFANRLDGAAFTPSPDAYQSLRQKLAEYSKTKPALAKALADAANVNAGMDLVSAAKAGAVVEALDEIATGASEKYQQARAAIMSAALTTVESDPTPVGPMPGRRPLFGRNPAMQPGMQSGQVQVMVMPRGRAAQMMQSRAAEMQKGAADMPQTREDMVRTMNLQARHADLARRWASDDISARELRIELVKYYVRQGCDQLDARFFAGDK